MDKAKAKVYGKELPISTKQAIAICNAIRGKEIEKALGLLEQVVTKKQAIAMKGEMAYHAVGERSIPGRYPVKAALHFIKLIKSLRANAAAKGLNVEALAITKAIANKAARPFRATRLAFGRKRFKRTNVLLEAEAEQPEKGKKSKSNPDKITSPKEPNKKC